MVKLHGTALARDILNDTRKKIATLSKPPLIHVKCSDTDQPYYKGIVKDAAYCGVKISPVHSTRVCGVISLENDWTPDWMLDLDGGLMTPCTAEAIMKLIYYHRIPLSGRDVCVVGRSKRVGKPLTNLLIDADATVTVCHSMTEKVCWNFHAKDIIISCVGNAKFDGRMMIGPRATVIDVGGDFVDFGDAGWVIPYVGGVGPVTRAVLMRHAYLKAAERERSNEK